MKPTKKQGRKQPFTANDVATIRAKLAAKGNTRDLALFETAISTMLRACDVTTLTAGDVTDKTGAVVESFETQQEKTSGAVRCALSATARAALANLIATNGLTASDYLFRRTDNAAKRTQTPLSTRMFENLVKEWADLAGYTDTRKFSGHSTRRTKAMFLYRETKDIDGIRELLGHTSLAHTAAYLSAGAEEAIALASRFEM